MKENSHKECPNESHCCKDESLCCYLINQKVLKLEIRKKGENK